MLRVHSYRCVIPSPTTTSKIGHPGSGRAVTQSELIEGDWEERGENKHENKGATECYESAPLIQVYMWGFYFVFFFVCTNLHCRKQHAQIWFVFSCPGQETNSLWLHFSDSVQHLKRIHLQLCKVTKQRPKYVGQATVLIQEMKDRAPL